MSYRLTTMGVDYIQEARDGRIDFEQAARDRDYHLQDNVATPAWNPNWALYGGLAGGALLLLWMLTKET